MVSILGDHNGVANLLVNKMKCKQCRRCKRQLDLKHYKRRKSDGNRNHICRRCYQHYTRSRLIERRIAMIEAYSNGKNACVCCGEKLYEFLTLDHIGNSRTELKHRHKNWTLRSLATKGFPHRDKLRVLCYNCNCAIGHLGYCPHMLKNKKQDVMTRVLCNRRQLGKVKNYG